MSDVSTLWVADTRGVGSAGAGERAAALEQVLCTCSCDGLVVGVEDDEPVANPATRQSARHSS